jgi:hypothetical protein|tara:strand:- start:106 stop:279 length:174 start_codon:yes stop_codon:yes gene_type:complete
MNIKTSKQGIITMSEAPKCGCGRSPTGNCIGWHALSEEDYQAKKAVYEARQADKAKK